MSSHRAEEITGFSGNMSTGILRDRVTERTLGDVPKADVLLEQVLARLNDLAKAGLVSHASIAAAINARGLTPGIRVYQQKVNETLSGEKKHPELTLLAAIAVALGTTLGRIVASIEANATIELDADWEWLMFGRRLGDHGQASFRAALEGSRLAPSGLTGRPERTLLVGRGKGEGRPELTPPTKTRTRVPVSGRERRRTQPKKG